MHTDFAAMVYRNHIMAKLDPERVKEIICSAVEIEKEFVTESLPVSLIGMNAKTMGDYIEFVADQLLADLGVPKHYGTKNPFPWMEMLGLEGKTNFFERKVSEYAKAGVTSGNNELNWGEEF
jgi:ribonucleotide reductase beta subunit family protein with ferritin-like domain